MFTVFIYINNRGSVQLYLNLFKHTAMSRFRVKEKFKI